MAKVQCWPATYFPNMTLK